MTRNLPAKADSQLPGGSLPAGEYAWDAGSLPPLPEEGINWRRLLMSVWRYRWLVVLVTVLGTAGGVAIARMIDPEYEAQSTIWIEVGRRGESRQGPIQQSELLHSSAWIDLLKSYVVLDAVVHDLRLYLSLADPADATAFTGFQLEERFVPGGYRLTVLADGRLELRGRGERVLDRAGPGEPIGSAVGFRWTHDPEVLTPGLEMEFSIGNPRDVATRLRDEINTGMNRDGNFLRLALRGSDRDRLAAILNTVGERYVEVAAELKGAKLQELTEVLDEQLRRAWQNLEEAEGTLERFRVHTITLPSEPATPVAPGLELTSNPAFQGYFALKVESEQLRRDRDALERELAAADSGISVEALEVIPVVRGASELVSALGELTEKRAELRYYRGRYSDEYPMVRQLARDIDALEASIVMLVQGLRDEVVSREAELDRLIASASAELSEIPPRAIEEARLERRVQIAENLYTNLRARLEEARLAAASSIPDVRVLDRAVAPLRPINQEDRPRFILLAFMASLGAAVLGAILLDRIDPRLKYPDQISRELGLAVLGTIPHVSEGGKQVGVQNTSEVVEAFRVVRLNLVHAYGTGPVIVAVTSPSPEDGKSFVVANLGLAFADLGRRTLVIDADIRRGRLHRLLGGDRKPGLTDYLAGKASLEQVVRPTQHGPLHRIACGTRRQDAPELMQSTAMSVLLAQLRPKYDVILIDCAPLTAGVDPLALGTLTGNILMVLRTGATDRELTEAKLDMLDALPIRLLGAVLNDVPPKGVYHYYRYASGYETWDEDTVETDYRPVNNVFMPNGETGGRKGRSGPPPTDGRPAPGPETPSVVVEPELHEGPRHREEGHPWVQDNGPGLSDHADWDVACSEARPPTQVKPAPVEHPADDGPGTVEISVEELAFHEVAGHDEYGNGARAPGGNGAACSTLDEYIEANLKNFREHQRRNRLRYWK